MGDAQKKLAKSATAVAALGVVFGDIGTSPLYAFQVALGAVEQVGQPEILGLVSLIFWALMAVVTIKYLGFILAVDNQGEGGILALSTRLGLHRNTAGRVDRLLFAIALCGGALLFGDAVITPAISVLSAIEGLREISPHLDRYVIPVVTVVLVIIFATQSLGVARISKLFGPVMLVWFTVIGLAGLFSAASMPQIFGAVWPGHAVNFALADPVRFMLVMGAVFLAVTGGEALYADLGQFGRPAIARAWILVAFPALMLNYFGQGAVVLSGEPLDGSPFFALFPDVLHIPAVILATVAAIIASQAVITGLFSLTRQGIELGVLPPITVSHKTSDNPHDVYLPLVNILVGSLSILVVWWFGSSERLANAYGVSVAGAMATTTIVYVAYRWRTRSGFWPSIAVVATGVPFIALDAVFLGANANKLLLGAMLPLALAGVVLVVVFVWRSGQKRIAVLSRRHRHVSARMSPSVVDGTAVFLTRHSGHAPRVYHQLLGAPGLTFQNRIIVHLLVPSRPFERRGTASVNERDGVLFVDLAVGYMEQINLPDRLQAALLDRDVDVAEATFFLGIGRSVPPAKIEAIRDIWLHFYCLIEKLAAGRNNRFGLPKDRTIEISTIWQL